MELEVLVSAMNEDGVSLAGKMGLATDAIVVNQCDRYGYEEFPCPKHEGFRVRWFDMKERGVGLSRNTCLMRASKDIVLFSDEDIVLAEGYEALILKAFEENPKADGIMFNVEVDERRRTYWNTRLRRIGALNYGRYPAYACAFRREALHKAGVCYSLLFGGGARYSNGEDSLFLHDCLKKGLRLYAHAGVIGREEYRESTWFSGYHEKFFFDRGVLYAHLYGSAAGLWGLRFVLCKRGAMCQEIPPGKAIKLLFAGIKEGRR